MLATILLVFAGLFALIIVIGIFIPSKYQFSRSIIINADKKIIFNTIDDLTTWKTWSAWSKENDPRIEISYGEITSGTGAIMEWKGKKMGKGKIEILKTEPYKDIQTSASFNKGVFKMEFSFLIEEMSAKEVNVKWIVKGRTRRSGFAKILGRMLPKWMGNDMATSLKVLKHLAEGNLA
ncbi:MAG: hypothetical protein ACHQFW_05760 [Chitinophagales bacterium]